MLDGYVSEKEQLESIRRWWHEHGKILLLAVAIGLLAGLAWRQWQKLSLQRSENAAVVYQQVLEADHAKDVSKVQSGVVMLKQHFGGTPYASLGALLAAKEAVNANQLPDALSQLEWVVDHGSNARLKEIARIDAARVLLAQSKPNDALTILKKTDDKSFMSIIDWVKGDIATAQGNADAAQKYYADAKKAFAGFAPAENVLTQLSSD